MEFKAAPSEDSKNYIRLKDKDSVRGVFRGEIFEFKKHWANGKSEFCTGQHCGLCISDPNKPAFRFRLNLLVQENGVFVPKIFEQGWTVYCALRDLNADYNLEKTLIKITRSGSGKSDTSYSVLPVPNGAVTPEIEARLAQVKLLDLKPSKDAALQSIPSFDSSEPLPF